MRTSRRTQCSAALPLLALLLVFSPFLNAAPAAHDECAVSCSPGQASVLKYESGEYLYEFESVINTEVLLPSPESRQTQVKAKVAITANSPCDFVLKVKALSVSDARGNNLAPIPDVQETPVRFTLQDGVIGSVCVGKNEPTYTANIKRAVISLLQNRALEGVSENEIVETDVSGRCPTKYSLSGDSYVKTKRLNACLQREGGLSVLYGVPYDVTSNLNSVPGISSSQSCEQNLENGIYKSIKCTETHAVKRPITRSKIIRTTVTTTLTLQGSKKGSKVRQPAGLVQSSILFDYHDDVSSQQEEVAATRARELVEKICNNVGTDGVSIEVPVLLLDLKDDIAHVKKGPLTQLYNDIKSGSLCAGQTEKAKRILVDAAAMSASDGAIGLLSELHQQGELGKVSKRQFYFFTTFAPHPHEDALSAVLPLLSGPGAGLSKRSILAISGLAHQFCTNTHPDCLGIGEYDAIVNRIGEIVSENLADESQSNVVITALQALGNLDHLTPGAVAAVTAALNSPNDRIRIRALDAFRRDPCQQPLRAASQGILANHNNAPNVRIGAFLADLRCLQPEDSAAIQNVLNDPESSQVSGFIYTALNNLARSSSQSNRGLQSVAKQVQRQLNYPDEIGRLSRNVESSLFSSTLNLGYSADGNVIFSKDSLILQQASANLTVDIFGQSFNLLEVGVYLENLGNIQETLLGPESQSAALYNRVLKRIGINRSSLPGPVAPSENSGPALLDVYVRVLGTTVGVVSVNAKRAEEVAAELKTKIQALLQGSVQSSSRDIHTITPILLLNGEIIVPTGSGLGLLSSTEASYIPSLEYTKTLQRTEGDQPFDLQLKIGSNVATSLKLRHSIVGGPIESGLQFEASLRSGGALDISLHRDSQRAEARINLPNDKLRALDVSTNVFWVSRQPGHSEVKSDFKPSLHVVPESEECDCPVNVLLARIGLKACVHSNINLLEGTRAIWNGKQYFSASLEKTESSMQGYAVLLTKQKNGNQRNYELSLDTPGSSVSRKLSITAHGEDDEEGNRKIDVDVNLPVGGPITFRYERTNNAAGRGIEAKLTTPKGSIGIHGEIGRQEAGNEITYKPALRIEYPEVGTGNPVKANLLTGKIIRNVGKSVTFDVSTQLPQRVVPDRLAELFIRGTILRNSPEGLDLEVKGLQVGARARDQGEPTPVLELDGIYKLQGHQQTTDLTAKYGRGLPHSLSYHKAILLEDGHVKLDAKIVSSRVPLLNVEISADVRRDADAGKYDSNIKVVGLNGKVTVTSQSHVVAPSLRNIDLQNTLTLSCPASGAEGTYDLTVITHAKNVIGEEQLLDVQVLKGAEGANGKITLKFERKAANNNDFQLHAAIDTKHLKGELHQTRETLNDDKAKSYSKSLKYETTLSSQLLGIERENLVVILRLLNKPGKRGISVNAHNTITTTRGSIPDLHLDLSAKTTPDKVSVNVDFKSGSNQVALLEVNILKKTSTTEPQVLIRSEVAKLYRISLTRRTPSENEATTKLHADILPTGRTITLDASRKRDGDVRTLDADLKWDSTRDPTKSIQVHSVTKISRGSILIDSKNDITVVGKQVHVNVDAKIPTEVLHGEHIVNVELVGTDGSTVEVKYSNNLNIEAALRKSIGQVSLKSPSGSPVQVKWDVQSVNPDLGALILDITAKVDLLIKGANSLNVAGHLDSNLDNGKRTVHYKVEVQGEAVPPASIDSTVVLGGRQLHTQTTVKLGSSGTELQIEGDLEANQVRVANLHVVLLNSQILKYKKVEAKLAHRRRADGTLDLSRDVSLTLDDQTALKYHYAISLVDGTLKAAAEAVVRDRQILDANLQGTINRQEIDVQGKIIANDINLSGNAHVNLRNPLQLSSVAVEAGAHGFSAKLEKKGETQYELANTLKVNGREFRVNAEATVAENEKALHVKYVKTTGEVAAEGEIKVTKSGDSRSITGSATLGSKKVEINGHVNKIQGGYSGDVTVKGPNVNGGAEFNVAINGDRRHIALSGGEAGKYIELITLDYAKTSSDHSTALEGTFSTQLLAALPVESIHSQDKATGTFKAEYNHLEEATDGETGVQLKVTATIHPDPPVTFDIVSELKATNLELLARTNVKGSAEGETGQIDKTGVVQLKRPAKGDATKRIIAQAALRDEKAHQIYGIISKTSITLDPKNLDSITQIILGNEQSDVLGVHVTATPTNGGVDLLLPSRQVSVAYTRQGLSSGTISAWLDKVRHPERKLNLALELEPITNEDGARGYKYQATLTHPDLSKALTISRRVVRFGSRTVVDSVTEIDILEDPRNKLVIHANIQRSEEAGVHLKGELSAKIEGLSLGFDVKGEIVTQNRALEAHTTYSFTRPNGQVITRNIEAVVSLRRQSLLVGDKADPILLLSRSCNLGSTTRRRRSAEGGKAIDTRYEIHLPGMSDTRIIDVHLHLALPPHLDINTHTTVPGKSYDLTVGFPNERQFVVSVVRDLGGAKTTLAEYSMTLQSNPILAVKAQWDIQAIKEVLKAAKERFEAAEDKLEDLSSEYVEQITGDVKLTAERLAQALPNLTPLRKHLQEELAEIKSEWGQDRLSKTISQLLRVISDALGGISEPLEKVLDFLVHLPENIRDLPKTIPGLLKKYDKQLKTLKRTIGSIIATILKVARPIIVQIQAVVQKLDLGSKANDAKAFREKAQEKIQSIIARIIEILISRTEKINDLAQASDVLSPEVKELISTVLNQVVSRLKGESTDFQQVSDKIRENIQKIVGEFLTVDLQNGVISALIPLPTPVHSLLDSVASGGKH